MNRKLKIRNALYNGVASIIAAVITTFCISIFSYAFNKILKDEEIFNGSWQDYLASILVGAISGFLSVFISDEAFLFAAPIIAIIITNTVFRYTKKEFVEDSDLVFDIILAIIVVLIVVNVTKYFFPNKNKRTENELLIIEEVIPVIVISNIILNINLLIFSNTMSVIFKNNNINQNPNVLLDADIFI